MTWQLRVLGEASLQGRGRRLVPERKTAAALTFLALEGPTPRSRLAGLLWPESGEERARGNLRQLLRRLRTATGDDLLEASDPLSLRDDLEVDVVELQAAAVDGRVKPVTSSAGELLAGHDYDDCPELLEWLIAQRERLLALRRELLEGEIGRLEADRDHQAALRLAERLLEFDPLSEEAYRRVMRLHYLLGDRAAALRVFARLRDTLQRELGVEPLPETVALAGEIERQAPSLPKRLPHRQLPLALERPPLLVGREAEWRALEQAWERGQVMVVRGEPGMGKTRLATDFVALHTGFRRFAARPGDRTFPYAMFIRGWQDGAASQHAAGLPAWARQELARLLPDLPGEGADVSGAAPDKSKLLEAMTLLMRAGVSTDRRAILLDDLQYADEASLEAVAYLLSALPREDGVRWVLSYRHGELSAETESWLRDLASSGAGAIVDLKPLDPAAVQELIDGLEIAGAQELARPLSRYTGGNPLFIVETLKSLAETGGLGAPFPTRFPAPPQLGEIIARRLERLSAPALRLARAIAVLEEAFDLEAGSQLLGADALDLAQPLSELESAQLLGERGLSHDLVHQAVLDGTPAAALRLLHGRAARYLEGLPVPPALIARHYLAAGDDIHAAPYLKEAGDSAVAAYRFDEALALYHHAAELLERHEDLEGAFEVLAGTVELYLKREYGPGHGDLEKALFRLARSPRQVAVAWQTRALFLQLLARAQESEAAAREGHRYALAAGDVSLQVELLNNVVGALWMQDRIEETVTILSEAIARGEECGDPLRLSEGVANMGVILDHLDRHREAIEYHSRAAALRNRHGGRLGQVQVMSNLAVSQAELGRVADSLATAEKMLLLLEEVQGATDLRVHALVSVGSAQRDLVRPQESIDALEQAVDLCADLGTWIAGPARRHLALTQLMLGRFEEALEQLRLAMSGVDLPDQFRSACLQAEAQVRFALGEDTRELLLEAERLLESSRRPLKLGSLATVQALTLPAVEGLAAAERALGLAQEHDLGGLAIAASSRCAQASLALGRPEQALPHSTEAVSLLEQFDAADFYLAEVLFTHFRVLAGCGCPEANGVLQRCLQLVEGAAARLRSEGDRRTFLEGNPVNREIMRTARELGVAATPAPPAP